MKNKDYTRNIVDTDADLKGISLQKHRALKRLLESIENDEKGIFVAIEYLDDVVSIDLDPKENVITMEQDKNYASKKFTLNSDEVLKSVRIFFDHYRATEYSEKIKFVFYTNTSITKERHTTVMKELKIVLPKQPILELLMINEYEDAISIFSSVFGKYYIDYYTDKTSDLDYYKTVLDMQTNETWIKFLNCIEWNFECDTEEEIWSMLMDVMKRLSLKLGFDSRFCEGILKSLLEQLDQNTRKVDFFDKLLHTAEIRNVLNEYLLESKIKLKIDPIHNEWDKVRNTDLNRGLVEKINEVCDEYDESSIIDMLDEYTMGTIEFQDVMYPAQSKSYKYRIYKIASKLIRRELLKKTEPNFTEIEIDSLIDEIIIEAYKHILDKSKTYDIPFQDKDMVRKTVIILVEDCFLSFEKEAGQFGIKKEVNV